MHKFYGEVWGGWTHLPQFWVDEFAEALPRLQAQQDLHLVRILDHIFPPGSEKEAGNRQKFINGLESQAMGEPVVKSMGGKDMVAQVALAGGEVITGPAFDHGIGRKRRSDFAGPG